MQAEHEQLDFTHIPPFPSDVPTVPLLRISLDKLVNHDAEEIERLWKACCEIGFFYLDLRQDAAARSGSVTLEHDDELFTLGEQFFALPVEEKQKYDFSDQSSYFGYKGYGKGVMDEHGTKDRNEFYNIAKDFVLGVREPLPEPDILRQSKNRALLQDFVQRSHTIVTVLLTILEQKLELPEGGLTNSHRINAVSGDIIRWVRAPPQPESSIDRSMGAHTGQWDANGHVWC